MIAASFTGLSFNNLVRKVQYVNWELGRMANLLSLPGKLLSTVKCFSITTEQFVGASASGCATYVAQATLAAAGVLTIVPGAIVIWFVRHYIAKGFAMGRV